ncbi:MAG TPA: ribosomal protein S18-alanine N-acetyltransferase [Iamia sp.]|nr:ribosomal protein S18-alanine N-acetyltransferase [Iamia sp.]
MAAAPETLAATAPVVVTPMRRRHLRQVLRIDHQVYPRPWSLGLYLGELSTTEGRSYLVARQGTQVVGYAGLMVIAGDAHVTTVAVAPAHQHRGLATRLLLVLMRDAVALGADRVTLEVRASNQGAQRLYSRFGFAPAGVRKAYYVDNREDAVIMWAIDVGTDDFAGRLARIEATLPTPSVLQGVWSEPSS